MSVQALKIGDFVDFIEPRKESLPSLEPKRWYVLRVQPMMELTATTNLVARQWRAYNPEIFKRGLVRGKMAEQRLPMFPGYIFIKLTEGQDDFGAPKKIRGVSGFLEFEPDDPAYLPDEIMPRIWAKEAAAKAHYYFEISPKSFKVGDPVTLPHSALPDELALIDELDNSGRVTLLMKMLGGVRKVRSHINQLAPV
jgi:transcriptional antiterminator RfaH